MAVTVVVVVVAAHMLGVALNTDALATFHGTHVTATASAITMGIAAPTFLSSVQVEEEQRQEVLLQVARLEVLLQVAQRVAQRVV